MYNIKSKNQLINEFTANADSKLGIINSYGNLREFMEKDDAGMAKFIINETNKIIKSSIPSGISIPEVSIYVSMNGTDNMIKVIDLILRNKYSSKYEFKFKKRVIYSENIFEVLVDFLKCSYIELIVDTLVRKNLDIVNLKLSEICEKAGNEFIVKIVSPLNNKGKKIVKITDNEIIFVADEERVLNLDDILVFCQPSEFLTESKIQQGLDNEVSKFAEALTTPQFIGVHDPLVNYICDISKLIKPFTLIKKVYSKNIDKAKGIKETFAFYLKDGVFSVIYLNEDGQEIALQPFNIDTLEVVDINILDEDNSTKVSDIETENEV